MSIKKSIKPFLLIYSLLFSYSSFSFNWNKCKRFISKDKSLTGAGGFGSTTSFLSSTGECAMIGDIEHDKKVYYVHNFDKMKDDFAKGSGEYAASFAKMHGCSLMSQNSYSKLMKNNFNKLMSIESTDSPETTYQYLESFFQENQALKADCNTKNNSA